MELSSNRKGRMPILFVLIHVDGFLRLISFDEFFFSFFESVLIFQMKCVLKMNFRKLILSMAVSKGESLFEVLLVSFEINSSFD